MDSNASTDGSAGPQPDFSITPQDRDMMIRTVVGEAGGEPDVGKVAVAHTILNRVEAGGYGDSPTAVVTAPNQFTPWQTRRTALLALSPDDPSYQRAATAVDAAISGQAPDPTGGAKNFYAPQLQAANGDPTPSFAKGPGTQIGRHVFFGGQQPTQQPAQPAGSGTTMAQASPGEMSDADIESLMMGRAPSGPAAAGASAPQVSAKPAAVAAVTSQPGELSDDDIGALMSGRAPQPGSTPAPGGANNPPIDPSQHPLTINARAAVPQAAPTRSPYGSVAPFTPSPTAQPDPQQAAYAQGGDDSAAVGRGIINGLPVVGPYALAGLNKLTAAARALTKDEPYSQALQEVQGFGNATADNHPTATTAGNVLGNVAAFGGLGSTALGARALGLTGDNLLMRMGAGGITNAAIGGGDAAVRSDGDPSATTYGALTGLGAGAAGPAVGGVLGVGANALSKYLQGFRPQASATKNLLQAIAGTGGDLPSIATRLDANPRLSLMDVNPGAQNIAQGLAAQSGDARNTLVSAYGQRAADAKGAVTGAYDAAMGPTPDVLATLDGIKATAAANAKTGFGNALAGAKPVDLSSTIQALDDQVHPRMDGVSTTYPNTGQPVAANADAVPAQAGQITPAASSSIPLSPIQQRMQQIKGMLTDGQTVLTDPARLHQIQSQLRTEADTLASSSSGSDRLMGKAVSDARGNIVDAIDDATGGTFKPAQKQYADDMSINDAFNKGLSIFSNRAGVSGLEDRPEYWRAFVANASPAEKDALTLGARTAADQQMGSVRNATRKGAAVPEIDFNSAKLKAVLGDQDANTLASRMADEQDIAQTNNKLFEGSQTQPREQAKAATAVRSIAPLAAEIGLPTFAASQGSYGTAAGLAALSLARRGLQYAGQRADLARNGAMANMLTASGSGGQDVVNRLLAAGGNYGGPTFGQSVSRGASVLTNAAPSGFPDPYQRVQSMGHLNQLLRAASGR